MSVVHFIVNPVKGSSFAKVACQHNVGGRSGFAREGTKDIAEVTCKKCLASRYGVAALAKKGA